MDRRCAVAVRRRLTSALPQQNDGFSEVAIPLDHVDAEEIRGPQAWDMTFIRNFMWVIVPVSSPFDFLAFCVLLVVLKASEQLFQTGWRPRYG